VIDRGTGTPVIIMPGIQGRWEWLEPAVDALAARCRVITFSLCDEPTSGFRFDPARGLDNYFDQLDAAFTRARLDRAVLVGVSYSGPIAVEFAARHPHRVRGLVLVSALPPNWTPNRRAQFYLRAPRLLSPLFLLDSPARVLPEIRSALPVLRDQVRFAAGQTRRALKAFLSPSRMAARLEWMTGYRYADPAVVRRPVLVITGEDGLDRVVSPALTRLYLAALPSAAHVVLERTGHLGLLTRADVFAQHVSRFAQEVTADEQRAFA
jgi:pimeloyl-ACP methyl ester carboxylesterase